MRQRNFAPSSSRSRSAPPQSGQIKPDALLRSRYERSTSLAIAYPLSGAQLAARIPCRWPRSALYPVSTTPMARGPKHWAAVQHSPSTEGRCVFSFGPGDNHVSSTVFAVSFCVLYGAHRRGRRLVRMQAMIIRMDSSVAALAPRRPTDRPRRAFEGAGPDCSGHHAGPERRPVHWIYRQGPPCRPRQSPWLRA